RCVESDAALAVLRILGPEDLLKLGADEAGTLKSVIETHLMHAEGELLELMIGALSRIGDDRSARCLAGLARLVDPDVHPETFQAIENALAHIQATEVAGELLDGEEKLAVLGARVLERIGGRRAAELVQSRLSQVQGHVRRAFVEALASIDVVGYRDTFKALLKDPDGHVVRSCLVALGRAGDPGDVDDMSRYLVHEYPDVREAALQGMVSIGTGRVQQVFVEMCGDPDPRRRLVGLAGLARVGSPHLGEIVRVFLGDPDAEVRLRAVNAARDASLMIEAGVLARLLEDEDEGVRYAAVELVGLGRAEDLRGKLEEIAAGEDLRAASIAIESLANFRDDAALGTLLEFMARGPDLLRITAIRALGNWGREDLVPRIEPYQDDANPDVVRSAMDAVDRLQGVRF
ncbi:MAG TPA: HEAT repeat domain-containing protein, partial [Deltaproteobacteria bacterium]|nr:HEAT repeat domain-containing protein [Deltaproteobacteria bacterium]